MCYALCVCVRYFVPLDRMSGYMCRFEPLTHLYVIIGCTLKQLLHSNNLFAHTFHLGPQIPNKH